MKKLFFIIPLSLSIAAIACSNPEETSSSEAVQEQSTPQSETVKEDVDVEKFAELVAKGDGQILDVRTPEEWAEGTVKEAIKMNFYDANFQEQLKKLDKTKPVYVYCKSGGRSGKAADQMQKMGFTSVYNLLGGMGAWNSAGKEVVK